jgi:hypothetical protein
LPDFEDVLAEERAMKHALRFPNFISDYREFETHGTFVSRLRARHSRKSGFWILIADPAPVTASHSR